MDKGGASPNLANELREFLRSTFDVDRIAEFRFGSGELLRFSTGGERDVPPNVVYEQAQDLYEAAFARHAEIFVLGITWIPRQEADPFLSALNKTHVGLDFVRGANFYGTESPDESIPFTQAIGQAIARDIDYRLLLTSIANSELALSPSTDYKVFFVNIDEPLIFHMYDDRGVDVLVRSAAASARLRAHPAYDPERSRR